MECMFEYMSCVIKNLAHGVKWAERVPGSHDWSVLAAGTSFGLAWTLFSPLVISRLILDPRIKRWLSMAENLPLIEASLISTRWISLHLLRTGRECFAVGAQHYQNMFVFEWDSFTRCVLIIYKNSIMLLWDFCESAVVCSGRRCVDDRILLQITLMSSLVRLDHTGSVQSVALVCIVRLVCFHSCSVLLRVLCLTSHHHQTQSVPANRSWTLMAFSNPLGGLL